MQVCVRVRVCYADCPQLTGYMDSPSYLYIKRKWRHCGLCCFTVCSHTRTHTHTQIEAGSLLLVWGSLLHRRAVSGVRVQSERISSSGGPSPLSSSACMGYLFHRGFPLCTMGGCWLCHLSHLSGAVTGRQCHSWDVRCVWERQRQEKGMRVWIGGVETQWEWHQRVRFSFRYSHEAIFEAYLQHTVKVNLATQS